MTTLNAVVINPAVPNLPLATPQYETRYQDQFANVLRLYFNRLQGAQQQVIDQLASTQAQCWLANSGGMFSG
jgi:hypothetical protein